MYIYQGVEFVVGLSTILITLADSYSDMIVFAVFYGFCDGSFITTLNVILLTCVEEAKRPASLGWNMQVASIFMGSGPPIAGRSKNVTDESLYVKPCSAHASICKRTRALASLLAGVRKLPLVFDAPGWLPRMLSCSTAINFILINVYSRRYKCTYTQVPKTWGNQ